MSTGRATIRLLLLMLSKQKLLALCPVFPKLSFQGLKEFIGNFRSNLAQVEKCHSVLKNYFSKFNVWFFLSHCGSNPAQKIGFPLSPARRFCQTIFNSLNTRNVEWPGMVRSIIHGRELQCLSPIETDDG